MNDETLQTVPALLSQHRVVIQSSSNQCISVSSSIRGVIHRCSYTFVKSAVIQRKPDNSGDLLVTWIDGSHCTVTFVSYSVLHNFVTKRAAFKNKIIEV